jgi:ribonuclease HI/probable phosphoglycerate mutase
MLDLVAYFDGGGSSQGGPGAWGVVLRWADGQPLDEFSGWGNDLTNNEAEYYGLIGALGAALDYQPRSLLVRGDSQLIIRQVTGKYRCKKPHLLPLRDMARSLIERMSCEVTLEHVPRERNRRADSLSTHALRNPRMARQQVLK